MVKIVKNPYLMVPGLSVALRAKIVGRGKFPLLVRGVELSYRGALSGEIIVESDFVSNNVVEVAEHSWQDSGILNVEQFQGVEE
jgi:hypothetical protein